jgi:hypothetical protein
MMMKVRLISQYIHIFRARGFALPGFRGNVADPSLDV